MSDTGIPEVDLFGDPVLSREEARGRPEHKWTRENSNKVLIAFAMRRSVKEAATAIGVSVPTLRKHYFSEVAKRDAAELRMEMTQLARLNTSAEGGNVAAEKELLKRLEKARLRALSQSVASQEPAPQRPQQPARKGKKQQAIEAAAQIEGIFAPPAPPSRLMN
ncbi:hypothetical protein ACVOMT_11625 [Sphingomonas panni]